MKTDDALERSEIIDHNFTKRVRTAKFPQPLSTTDINDAELSTSSVLEIFHSQIESRHLDLVARKLRKKHKAFYTIGSSGHEGNAALAAACRYNDIAFLHYRSTAFMLQRAREQFGDPKLFDHLLAYVASRDDPMSSGRHKVFGNAALYVPPQTSTIASHLPKALGTAFSIPLTKELNTPANLPLDSIVLCSFGDASLNHSTAQGAINSMQWIANHHLPLPIMLICEDNGVGISVPTPKDWIEETIGNRVDMEFFSCDALNICDIFKTAQLAQRSARVLKKPVFLHFKTVRLLGHAGSDIETNYHSTKMITQAEDNDPLLHSARILCDEGILSTTQIIDLYEAKRAQIHKLAELATKSPKLSSSALISNHIIPPKLTRAVPAATTTEYKEHYTMAQALNITLHDLMLQYPMLTLFGEDIGKKGGVYNITANLQKKFGARRIFDTPLDEQTILGTAIGFAHNNLLPMPEIQFIAYLHNAIDQIRGEAATLPFFSSGQFSNPMIIRVPAFAYQLNFGGHFHSENSLAFLREIPGVLIACPSNAFDAVCLLKKCVELAYIEQRVVVFLEPIALYFAKDLYEKNDHKYLCQYPTPQEYEQFGNINIYGNSKKLAIITFANGVMLSRQAAKIIYEKYKIEIKIIDLRWLAPIHIQEIITAITNIPNLLIVDETRKTGSISEHLITQLVENLLPLPNICRLTAADSFIPLGPAARHVLPSVDDIIDQVEQMIR